MPNTPVQRVDPRPNYWEYIRVEELLALQGGLENDEAQLSDDEVLFITVHQVFELWFKLILRELATLRDQLAEPFAENRVPIAVESTRRVTAILRRAVDHFEVVETLRTREYLAFRDKLSPASGFQSAQMRQMEILLGLADEDRIDMGVGASYQEALRAHDGGHSPALERVKRALEQRLSLRDSLDEWLFRTPIGGIGPDDAGADEALEQFVRAYTEAHTREIALTSKIASELAQGPADRKRLDDRYRAEVASLAKFFAADEDPQPVRRRRIRAAVLLIVTFSELPLLAWPNKLLDSVVELEQQMVVFRQRHARMVERVIGRRTGTGGSSGVDYLDRTAIEYRVFKDLWAVRTFQIRASAAPELASARFYSFVAE